MERSCWWNAKKDEICDTVLQGSLYFQVKFQAHRFVSSDRSAVVPSIQVSKSWQSIKASAGREVKRVARETRDAMVLLRHTAKHGEQQVPW